MEGDAGRGGDRAEEKVLSVLQLGAGFRPAALIPRLVLLILLVVLVLAAWIPLRSGTSPQVRASEVGADKSLRAALEAHHGLMADEGNVRFLSPPADRAWTQGLDFVPALACAKRDGPGEVEDVFYMEVRTTRDGSPLQVRRLTNLTRTPHAAEKLLAIDGHTALMSVEVFGQLQSLLLVDALKDERDTQALKTDADRWRHQITNLQNTGRMDGVGMRLYSLDPPPKSVKVTVAPTLWSLAMEGDEDRPDSQVKLNIATGELQAEPAQGATGLTYQPRYFAEKSLVPWLVDTIRNLSWVGPRKIALLEKFVFHWKDNIKRGAFALGLVSEEGNLAEELGSVDPQGSGIAAASAVERVGDWPPPPVKPGVKSPAPGEGQWSAARMPWLRTIKGAPPAFMKTAVRMDPSRPYDNVVLIAMDMRQLSMGLVPGTITPESSFGNRGSGLMSREAEVTDRLVAAFNGGFKTAHGAYGMVVKRKTIMPAMPFAATIAVNDQNQVMMGSWYNSMTPPDEIHSLRQNLPPLLADGVFNPTRKRKWGGTANDLDGIHTTRSGVGIRGNDTLIYAWCKSCSADSLGLAMLSAGCEYGMHLDMNPTHTGFAYYRTESTSIRDNQHTNFKVAAGSPAMGFREDRYLRRDVKDFFYLTLRETFADRLPIPPQGFSAWEAAAAPTGEEGFMPLAALSRTGEPGQGIVAIDLARLGSQMRRGDKEPDPTQGLGQGGAAAELTLKDPALLIDLGVTDLQTPVGFFTEGRIMAPVVQGQPAMTLEKGSLRFVSPQQARSATPRSVEHLRGGIALIIDGQARSLASLKATGTHHALGIAENGALYYGAMNDPEALQQALIQQGVTTAFLLPASPASKGSRVRFLKVAKDGALTEVDPFTGTATAVSAERRASTHLYLERKPGSPTVRYMRLEEVELSKEEARRQARLQDQIRALRQELRQVENAKYRAFQERLKERENKQ